MGEGGQKGKVREGMDGANKRRGECGRVIWHEGRGNVWEG